MLQEAKPEAVVSRPKAVEFYPEEGRVRVLDVTLEVLDLPQDIKARRYVPSWSQMKDTVCWDTPTVRLVRDLGLRLAGGIATRTEGPTGVSKSFAVEVLAALTKRNYLRHNYSRDSDPGDTIGRFVPSDKKLAVRFKELLADPGLSEESRALVKNAERENRMLTMYESKKLAKNEGLSGLEDSQQWRWHNGTLTGSMVYGSLYAADEPNLAPGNVVERENPAIEKRPKLRLVEHEGEIIRALTPAEQSIVNDGGVVPGVIGLDQAYWYVAAQNPHGIGGGRIEESEARRNRLQDRIVEGLTTTEYEEFLKFLVFGRQPDIIWQGKTYRGEKNVHTPYRQLENVPNAEVVFTWLAQFQTDLQGLALAGRIGSEKDIKGGSYVYTRRNIERFLDSIMGSRLSLINVEELFKTGKIVSNDNWHDLFMEGLYQEYLSGMYQEDAEIIKELIAASGLEDLLGPSVNNPEPPAWVKKARKKGLKVEMGANSWILSQLDLSSPVDIDGVLKEAGTADYRVINSNENDQEIFINRPIRSIIEVWPKKESPEETEKTDNKKDSSIEA